MKIFFKYLTIFGLTIPNTLFGQSIIADSTKPSPFIVYCNYQNCHDDKIEYPINLDWVQLDKESIKSKLNRLPENGSTLTEIKKLIPDFLDGRSITVDLGYNLKSTQHTLYGGYGSCNVDAIYFGDNVLKMRLTINNHKEIIEKYLLQVIQLPFQCSDGQISYEKTYSENVKKYVKDSGRLFIESVDTNSRRRQAINYFTDILTGGTFTEPYYIYSLGSELFNNLRYFIVNKDYVALESILFSPSPTGRLFAARTLLYLKEKFSYNPNEETNKRLKEVLRDAKLIRTGDQNVAGSTIKYYDIVKDFEKLLMTE
jgi:hypothetical protein